MKVFIEQHLVSTKHVQILPIDIYCHSWEVKTVAHKNKMQDINSTYFISVGVEVSAIYIDQCQISSLWYLRVNQHNESFVGSQLLYPKMFPDVADKFSGTASGWKALLTASSSQPSTSSYKASRAEQADAVQTAVPVTATATWIAPSWCLHNPLSPHPPDSTTTTTTTHNQLPTGNHAHTGHAHIQQKLEIN